MTVLLGCFQRQMMHKCMKATYASLSVQGPPGLGRLCRICSHSPKHRARCQSSGATWVRNLTLHVGRGTCPSAWCLHIVSAAGRCQQCRMVDNH